MGHSALTLCGMAFYFLMVGSCLASMNTLGFSPVLAIALDRILTQIHSARVLALRNETPWHGLSVSVSFGSLSRSSIALKIVGFFNGPSPEDLFLVIELSCEVVQFSSFLCSGIDFGFPHLGCCFVQ